MNLSLKLLAVYMWSYVPVFILSFLPIRDSVLGKMLIREAQVANWEFELLFAALFFVWGIFLWICSRDPHKNRLFIDFTIWTSVVHIAWMLFIALTNVPDAVHMVRDALIPIIITGFTLYYRRKLFKSISAK